MNNDLKKWIMICFIIGSILLILIGFAIGYIYTNKQGCIENPFGFGIRKLNKIYGGDFICTCHTHQGSQPLFFNEHGIVD